MPDYLKANHEAEEVWFEEIERVTAAGVTDTASSSFAAYCALEASIRATYRRGEVPRGAYMSEARKMREELGLSGPGKRTTADTPTDPLSPEGNPFAAL